MLETYYRHTLKKAEECAAQMELATGASYTVRKVAESRYQIAPGRLMTAVSLSMEGEPNEKIIFKTRTK